MAGKIGAVDGQGSARRDRRGVCGLQDQRIQKAHFLLEQADGVFASGGAQRVAADELCQQGSLVGGRKPLRPHLVENRCMSPPGDLPCRLAAGQAAADNDNGGVGIHRGNGSPAAGRTRLWAS